MYPVSLGLGLASIQEICRADVCYPPADGEQFKPVGSVSVVPGELKDGPVTEMSVSAISGPLGRSCTAYV